MNTPSFPDLRSTLDIERVVEFEFVRATENAAMRRRSNFPRPANRRMAFRMKPRQSFASVALSSTGRLSNVT
jgi:hypothetical protein